MSSGIGLKEGVLRVTELLGIRSETFIIKERAISREFQKLRISIRIWHNLEVRVIKNQPTISPRTSARLVVGFFTVGPDLLATIGELGLFFTQTRTIFISAAKCVRSRQSNAKQKTERRRRCKIPIKLWCNTKSETLTSPHHSSPYDKRLFANDLEEWYLQSKRFLPGRHTFLPGQARHQGGYLPYCNRQD